MRRIRSALFGYLLEKRETNGSFIATPGLVVALIEGQWWIAAVLFLFAWGVNFAATQNAKD